MDANIKKQLLDPRNTRELVKITKTLDIEKLQLLLNEIDIPAIKETILAANAKRIPTIFLANYINDTLDEDIDDIIYFIGQCRLDFYKVIILLEQCKLNDSDLQTIFKELYPDIRKSRRDIMNNLIKETLQAIETGKDSEVFDIMIGDGDNVININLVLEAIKKANIKIFSNISKPISKRYFQVYFELFARYIAYYKQDYKNDIVVYTNLDDLTTGFEKYKSKGCLVEAACFSSILGGIMIRPSDIEDTISDNLKNIETIFHEVRHLYQKGLQGESNNYSYDSLLFSMEDILQNRSKGYYDINYDVVSFEIDAETHALVDTYQFLKTVRKSSAKAYLREMIGDFKAYQEDKKDLNREIPIEDSEETDFLTVYEALPKVQSSDLYRYPILKTIYKSDGKRKTLGELIRDFQLVENEYKRNKNRLIGAKYALYLKVLKDYIDIYKRKRNEEVEIDKSTKEIVEEFIESKKHK